MGTKNEKLCFPVVTAKNISNNTAESEETSQENESLTLEFKLPTYYELSNTNPLDKSNYLIHKAYETERNNQRQGTVSTKTRSEVRGGGRKPWRQKGTGKARAGSTRSPLWRGGGVSFGPKPKIYYKKLNRKEWRLGLRLLLAKKQKSLIVVDRFCLNSISTKLFIEQLQNFGVPSTESSLIILPEINENFRLSIKNLKNIELCKANNLSVKSLLQTKNIILTKESFKLIQEIYNG